MTVQNKMVLNPKEVEAIAAPAFLKLFRAVRQRDYLMQVWLPELFKVPYFPKRRKWQGWISPLCQATRQASLVLWLGKCARGQSFLRRPCQPRTLRRRLACGAVVPKIALTRARAFREGYPLSFPSGDDAAKLTFPVTCLPLAVALLSLVGL